MSEQCRALILERIRQHGPLTFAEFMDLALYHPQVGYYASATRRSGRTGDFYTSVDVAPLFGELLAEQFAEMGRVMIASSEVRSPKVRSQTSDVGRRTPGDDVAISAVAQGFSPATLDLVEAGAGDGRLSRDVLDALEPIAPDLYARVQLHLVERSAAARQVQRETLGRHASKLASSTTDLPSPIHGIVFANELLDALPTHAVVAREGGLHEIFIDALDDQLIERELPASTPAIEERLARLEVRLRPGWRAEVNLRAIEWMREAAGALRHGFLVLADYGHEANVLYSASHAQGTLATFTGHVVETRGDGPAGPWLRDPGGSDITAHVDFTSIRQAAEAEGLDAVCIVDQMHFLMGLGIESKLRESRGSQREDVTRRLALKTLLIPGGLGTSHHVMIFGKNVGRPALRGCSRSRWTAAGRVFGAADPRH
jgi:SAM-dependent MidA family methyltransferase